MEICDQGCSHTEPFTPSCRWKPTESSPELIKPRCLTSPAPLASPWQKSAIGLVSEHNAKGEATSAAARTTRPMKMTYRPGMGWGHQVARPHPLHQIPSLVAIAMPNLRTNAATSQGQWGPCQDAKTVSGTGSCRWKGTEILRSTWGTQVTTQGLHGKNGLATPGERQHYSREDL